MSILSVKFVKFAGVIIQMGLVELLGKAIAKQKLNEPSKPVLSAELKISFENECRRSENRIIADIESDDLGLWLRQVQGCQSKDAIFNLLDKFRPLPWTDEQRAQMAHAYHRRLNEVNKNE